MGYIAWPAPGAWLYGVAALERTKLVVGQRLPRFPEHTIAIATRLEIEDADVGEFRECPRIEEEFVGESP